MTESPASRFPALTGRQALVLRALIARYVGDAAPVGSRSLSEVLSIPLSAASIRNTMAELAELGLLEKPHASAGRMPTALGLRVFVDGVSPRGVDEFERRDLAAGIEEPDPAALIRVASRLLSERTRQLGFVVVPRAEELVLRHLSLVRLSASRVLALVVAESGEMLRRVVEDEASGGQRELDGLAAVLNERFAGCTLTETRDRLAREVASLRSRAEGVLERAQRLALRALPGEDGPGEGGSSPPGDLVIATWLALLDQPEFQDAGRVKELLAAIETRQALLQLVERVLGAGGVTFALGEELGEPGLRQLALVAAPYGSGGASGVLGVIGPRRMDYARVMGLVGYLSELVTRKLST
ncbi:heat-inducible transcription repressor HrcA [Myxococcota bacterium]|nr:heat-inducible transcription repressor HrcA [Myxococcota bacterium]